jgi:hypothetical protein
VILPSATVFLLLLCNDHEVLGPWANPPWLNAIASVIIAILIELSLILMASTLFPQINVTRLFEYLSLGFLLGLLAAGAYTLRARATRVQMTDEAPVVDRRTWTMPPLALLERPVWSPGRKTAMLVLRGYLLVAMILLVVKTVQLAH